jgi:hypothetical protein
MERLHIRTTSLRPNARLECQLKIVRVAAVSGTWSPSLAKSKDSGERRDAFDTLISINCLRHSIARLVVLN